MIISDAYCHAKYAQRSREWFLAHSRIARLDFFSKVKIFEAAVRNITYLFQKSDGMANAPERRVHHPEFGAVNYCQLTNKLSFTQRVFFPEDTNVQQFSAPTIPIEAMCYISVGMVVHADEKRAKVHLD